MKKIALLFIVFFINTLFSLCAFAENFYITSYDVDLTVHKNKDVDVIENVGVYFTRPSHGIYRNIPTKVNLHYEDGGRSFLNARISNVQINEPFLIQKDISSTVFKIGDASKLVSGPKQYQIKYKYSMGKDLLRAGDDFYFNIIGTKWDTTIDNIKFKITLPLPYSNLRNTTGFSIGGLDSSGYNIKDLNYFIENNKIITGRVNRVLEPLEGLTVRILLHNNYFVPEVKFLDKDFIYVLVSVLTLIAFIMWFIFGRDEKVIPVVNFYPPKNRNSAEVGVEYKGVASQKEIVSLIMYLANKGYLEIEDDGVSYSLHKLKDYDGKNSCERRLMSVLFKTSDIVTAEDLQFSRSFYRNCESIIASLNNIRKFIFDKNANSPEKMVLLFICILGILLSILYVLGDYSFSLFFSPDAFLLLFPIVGALVVFSVVYGMMKSNESGAAKISKGIFITIWGSMFMGIPTLIILTKVYNSVIENIPILVYSFICIIVSIFCLINMPKRNKQGRMLLGHIEGFKKFLEVAEKRRLESLIAENRNYASDILPFAYVLDISDKILPVLESLSLYTQPNWYKGKMSGRTFSTFVSTMEKATAPSVENGGISRSSGSGGGGRGFSGGGFSGRGGGGGGGGSW